MKLVFGFPVHEKFESAVDLYHTIQKFYPGSKVVFASNQDLGQGFDNFIKLKAKREYSWGHSHQFVMDCFEQIVDWEFDYFIKIDSDCLITNHGLEKVIEGYDYNIDRFKDSRNWMHGWFFKKNISDYLVILKTIDIPMPKSDLVGSIAAFAFFSKKAVNYIKSKISLFENTSYYKRLSGIPDICIDEILVFNILKDAGFKYLEGQKGKEFNIIPSIRYRPHWKVNEIEGVTTKDYEIAYHPVSRDETDEFRKYILQKLETRKNE